MYLKTIKKTVVFGLLVLILGGSISGNNASAVDPTLSLQPGNQSINLNEEFDITAHVDNVTDLQGYQLEIMFDPTKFEYVSHSYLGLLGPAFPTIPTISVGKINWLSEAGFSTFSGSGDLVTIRFREISGSSTEYASIISFSTYNQTGKDCILSDDEANVIPDVSLENAVVYMTSGDEINPQYMVNGSGEGNGNGKYWPGDQGYFDARFTPTIAAGGETTYPGWCADIDTYIKLGWWYDNNIGCYSSLTAVNCQFVDNPNNLPLVNYLLFLYRYRDVSDMPPLPSYIMGATKKEIQAVIWFLLFNDDRWGHDLTQGGGITWDLSIVLEIYDYLMVSWYPLPYSLNPDLPIVLIIDCGDQVNLLEIPYWLYEILVNLGVVEDC